MRHPPLMGTSFDKTLQYDVVPEDAPEVEDVAHEMLPVQEDMPSAIPVQAGRRTAQPHCIAIAKPKRGEHTRTGVRHERRIEVSQPAATDKDSNYERRRSDKAPRHRMRRVGTGRGKDTLLHMLLGNGNGHALRG